MCGNVVHAAGEGAFSCCGILLPALEPEEGDDAHHLVVEQIDGDFHVSLDHPMDKRHYLSFMAYVTTDRVHMRKLYPEQAPEARFPVMGPGILYAFCNHHGLFTLKARPARPQR